MSLAKSPMPHSVARIVTAGVAAWAMAVLHGPSTAAADSCIDQVREMASQHSTPSKPPTASSSGAADIKTEDLARSGGVIAPPAMDDKSVIKPPSTGVDRMPTVPDIAPQTQNRQ